MTDTTIEPNNSKEVVENDATENGAEKPIANETKIQHKSENKLADKQPSVISNKSTKQNINFEPMPSRKATFPSRQFGWKKFRPEILQRLCTAKWALFWLCWAGALQGLIVNGFINVVITTIERRFGLRSKQTGLVASGYDIASFLCLVPVTYFGGRINASKPRWIAWGVILMGLGSLTFSLPHFLAKPYRATANDLNVCTTVDNDTRIVPVQECDGGTIAAHENLQWTMWLFFISQLLHGAGASPLYTLGVTFIDENVSKKMSSIYLGIFYTMAILGPALGYVLGGQLLLIYTDFLTVDAKDLTFDTTSKVWIGAWWIGFIFAAFLCFILAIPIFAYPRKLPGFEEINKSKSSEAYNEGSSSRTTMKQFSKLKELPKAVIQLFKNPTFIFLNLAGASEGLVIAGFAAFLPKEMENTFNISPTWSAFVVGLITVPAGGGGTFLGGYLVKKLKLTCTGIIKLCLIVTVVAACFTLCLLLRCPNLKYAGVVVPYQVGSDEKMSIKATCNANCGCQMSKYDPVCGADSLMYLSPCFAGCHVEKVMGQNMIYINCSCIDADASTNGGYEAINTMCSSDCTLLKYFIVLCFVMMLFTFLATMPALSATLRCLRPEQRSFGLGIQWIKVRLLGTIPSPMLFGALIDKTCVLWQDSCDDTGGACLIFDSKLMSRFMFMMALLAKSCSAIFFFAAWWFYIPPQKGYDESVDDKQHGHDNAAPVDESDEEVILESVKFRELDSKYQLEK